MGVYAGCEEKHKIMVVLISNSKLFTNWEVVCRAKDEYVMLAISVDFLVSQGESKTIQLFVEKERERMIKDTNTELNKNMLTF